MSESETMTAPASETTLTEAIADSTPTPAKKKAAKPKAKAAVKKPAAKKAVSKPAPKKESKKVAAPRAVKEGLRLMQVRALKALYPTDDALPIVKIAAKAGISTAVVSRGLGPVDPSLSKSHDQRNGFPSLVTLGMIRVTEEEGVHGFGITSKGRKALDKFLEATPKLPKVHANPYA